MRSGSRLGLGIDPQELRLQQLGHQLRLDIQVLLLLHHLDEVGKGEAEGGLGQGHAVVGLGQLVNARQLEACSSLLRKSQQDRTTGRICSMSAAWKLNIPSITNK